MANRVVLERTWVLGVIVFVVARFALAYGAIGDESRSAVIVFGVLDLVTAVPYAIATARIVTSLVDRNVQSAATWGIVASVSFLAPYAWLAWVGRDGSFGLLVYLAIALFVVSIGTHAVLTIRKRARAERRAADGSGELDPPYAAGVGAR
jgi:hypothetical protein